MIELWAIQAHLFHHKYGFADDADNIETQYKVIEVNLTNPAG